MFSPTSLLEQLEGIPTPVISDALDDSGINGALPLVRPLSMQQRRSAGYARTARFQRLSERPGDVRPGGGVGGPLEAVLQSMQADDFVVIDLDAATTAASWGGLASRIAQGRAVRGTVVYGGCRDAAEIVELGYGVWSVATTPRRSRNEFALGELGGALQIGRVRIDPGDIIVADDSGVVCVPAQLATKIVERCEQILRVEAELTHAIARKDSDLDWDQV
ncbi:RraA family protein [Bradyrhizobium guangzhouense]|uniref:RraA family protein n=1 Tax=Bradyrhizobium guangzhouense TaxID=1325095 RepID=UPI0010099640|nr:RraA family protein [Bradyrhizobium guangzhouense]RXH11389.1 RraA family protein [Bradyrhizobium guangzhouense]